MIEYSVDASSTLATKSTASLGSRKAEASIRLGMAPPEHGELLLYVVITLHSAIARSKRDARPVMIRWTSRPEPRPRASGRAARRASGGQRAGLVRRHRGRLGGALRHRVPPPHRRLDLRSK